MFGCTSFPPWPAARRKKTGLCFGLTSAMTMMRGGWSGDSTRPNCLPCQTRSLPNGSSLGGGFAGRVPQHCCGVATCPRKRPGGWSGSCGIANRPIERPPGMRYGVAQSPTNTPLSCWPVSWTTRNRSNARWPARCSKQRRSTSPMTTSRNTWIQLGDGVWAILTTTNCLPISTALWHLSHGGQDSTSPRYSSIRRTRRSKSSSNSLSV